MADAGRVEDHSPPLSHRMCILLLTTIDRSTMMSCDKAFAMPSVVRDKMKRKASITLATPPTGGGKVVGTVTAIGGNVGGTGHVERT